LAARAVGGGVGRDGGIIVFGDGALTESDV